MIPPLRPGLPLPHLCWSRSYRQDPSRVYNLWIESGLSHRRSRKLRLAGERVAAGRQCDRFVIFEYSLPGKWLELLKEITPEVKRAAVLCDPSLAFGIGQIGALQAVGPTGLNLSAIDVRHATEIARDAAEFAHGN